MKLWGGRFTEGVKQLVNTFNSSISIDSRMYKEDIEGSLAHVKMLGKQGIIPSEDSKKIVEGLKEILIRIDNGTIQIDKDAEDIHSFVESILTYYIGDEGKKLHTGRSRNDQVTLDTKLYLKKYIKIIINEILKLHETLLEKANENINTIMPGYTHMQKAQPITFAHHILAYCEMFKRDIGRLFDSYKRLDEMPLGSGALATSTYPIDREFVASELGFSKITLNSLDSVSDRDYAIETLSALSLIMMHLSRFCEELLLWSSHEFKFVSLSDAYSTGSSIMPQKKNPDMAELIRGKTGRVYGNLTALLTVMKGLPLAYNKDLQEDKEGMFDSADTIITSLTVMNGMLSTLTVNRVNMEKSTEQDFSNATELADYLAAKGLPFRKAHELVGLLVLDCIKKGIYLQDVNLQDYQMLSPLINEDVYEVLKSRTAVSRRNSLGGTGFESVKKQIEEAKKELQI